MSLLYFSFEHWSHNAIAINFQLLTSDQPRSTFTIHAFCFALSFFRPHKNQLTRWSARRYPPHDYHIQILSVFYIHEDTRVSASGTFTRDELEQKGKKTHNIPHCFLFIFFLLRRFIQSLTKIWRQCDKAKQYRAWAAYY